MRIPLTWALLLSSFSLWGQQRIVKFDPVTISEELSETTIYAIARDSKGFLWFGTQDGGLNRFDGYEVFSIFADPAREDWLPINNISEIHADRDGYFWLALWGGGLSGFDPLAMRFRNYAFDPDDPGSIPSDQVQTVLRDREGLVWVGTVDSGLAVMDPAVGRFTHYPAREDVLGPSDARIWDIVQDTDGDLWIGTSQGLNRVDRRTRRFTHYPVADRGGTSSAEVRALCLDRAGNLWIGTEAGLDRFDIQGDSIEHMVPYPDPDTPSQNHVNTILEDSQGRIWVGLTSGGLVRYDRTVGEFAYVVTTHRATFYNDIRCILEDQSGNIWIGTRGGGVSRLNPQRFEHYANNPLDPDSLGDNRVRAFCEDGTGRFWVGTLDGINEMDRAFGRFTRYRARADDPDSLSHRSVNAIHEDSLGVLWVGTNHGLNASDTNLDVPSFTRYYHDPDDPESLPGNRINTIHEDMLDRLWVGTYSGLAHLDRNTDRFVRIPSDRDDPGALSDPVISCLLADTDILWVGTQNGLNSLDPITGAIERYGAGEQGLVHPTVLSLSREPAGQGTGLWIGTRGGLSYLDRKTDQFRTYTVRDGLPNQRVLGILADDAGYLWLSTGFGLARMDPRSGTFKSYGLRHGLQSYRFSRFAYYKSLDGKLYFGGDNGFNCFFPEDIRINLNVPEVVLTSIIIDREETLTPKDLHGLETLELARARNGVAFTYAALDYTNPELNRYRYKLEGFDRDWIEAGDRRFAEYNNLPPGDYVFRVLAANNDDVMNEEGLALRVSVAPALLETWWVNLILIAVLTALIVAVVLWRTHHLARQRGSLRVAVREKEIQLEVVRSETEKHKREHHVAEERFRTVAESVRDAVVLCDAEHRIVYWNPAARSLFGYDRRGNMVGKALVDLEEGEASGPLRRALEERLGAGKSFTTRGRRADQTAFPLEVVLRRFHTGAGEMICAVMRGAAGEREPSSGASPVEPMPDVIAGFQGPPKKILIVDDKRDRRIQIDRILRPLGFQLIHAENGRQAIERTEREKPDLVLMDLVMPVMDGLEATRAIRRAGRTALPIIAVSSPAFEGLHEKAGAAGCDAVLTKPISRRKLLAAIGRHLDLSWVHLGAPTG